MPPVSRRHIPVGAFVITGSGGLSLRAKPQTAHQPPISFPFHFRPLPSSLNYVSLLGRGEGYCSSRQAQRRDVNASHRVPAAGYDQQGHPHTGQRDPLQPCGTAETYSAENTTGGPRSASWAMWLKHAASPPASSSRSAPACLINKHVFADKARVSGFPIVACSNRMSYLRNFRQISIV